MQPPRGPRSKREVEERQEGVLSVPRASNSEASEASRMRHIIQHFTIEDPNQNPLHKACLKLTRTHQRRRSDMPVVWYYEETRATRKRGESKFELASGNAKPDSWIRPPSGISCTSTVRVVMFGSFLVLNGCLSQRWVLLCSSRRRVLSFLADNQH